MKYKITLGILMGLILIASVSAAQTVDLLAGQDIDVGSVEVSQNGDNLSVIYTTEDGWKMTETHLAVECNVSEIPQTESKGKGKAPSGENGNPIPGQFEYKTEHDPAATTYTYEVNTSNLECNSESLAIAAHAVVEKEGEVIGYTDVEETLYLTDSGPEGTDLFSVELIEGENKANLTLLYNLPADYFDQVDAIASTPNGEVIYVVDKNSGHLGKYNVSANTFDDIGSISNYPQEVVLASFSPEGELYVVSQGNNGIYKLENLDTSPNAIFVGDTGINVQGADIAFDADGTLYLYSSANGGNLYTVNTTTGEATFVGNTGGSFTGLAVLDAGLGDLVGSSTSDDTIYVINKTDGSKGTGYEMYLGDSPYDYSWGDMTVGELSEPVYGEYQEETAWANGTRFVEKGNWATWFEYELDPILVDSLSVSANTSDPVESKIVLDSGSSYTIKVIGTWMNGENRDVDAEYISDDNWDTFSEGPSFNESNLELQVNDEFVDWGNYDSSHEYTLPYSGSDSKVSFRIFDGDPSTDTINPSWYEDNSGELTVEIYKTF